MLLHLHLNSSLIDNLLLTSMCTIVIVIFIHHPISVGVRITRIVHNILVLMIDHALLIRLQCFTAFGNNSGCWLHGYSRTSMLLNAILPTMVIRLLIRLGLGLVTDLILILMRLLFMMCCLP